MSEEEPIDIYQTVESLRSEVSELRQRLMGSQPEAPPAIDGVQTIRLPGSGGERDDRVSNGIMRELQQMLRELRSQVEDLRRRIPMASHESDSFPGFTKQTVEVVTGVTCAGGNVVGTTRQLRVLAEAE